MNYKKIAVFFAVVLCFLGFSITAYAQIGDIGFFGGITEGRALPKTTEILLSQSVTKKKNEKATFSYKELIFLNGAPLEFDGKIEVSSSGTAAGAIGTYTQTLKVTPLSNTVFPKINRNIVFDVSFRNEGTNTILDYKPRTWTETIDVDENTKYTLNRTLSNFVISIVVDHTPGVNYYRGDISSAIVYNNNTSAVPVKIENNGVFYGYENAWSTVETHIMDSTVHADGWQMSFQVRPSVQVTKTIQYVQNQPTAISFSGNYREVMQNLSGLRYDIFIKPQFMYSIPDSGSASIDTFNSFEQLITTDLASLKGHPAEEDIKRLFSMQVFEGDPKFFKPDQAITRGQYVTALVKALKLPIEETAQKTTSTKKTPPVVLTFPDVLPTMPEYPYVMAAYNAGLAIGRDNGNFYFDSPIERQEAIAILMRALGLEQLGLDPTPVTSYADDAKIGNWAKREIYAATRIGLIMPDVNGNIRPTELISKAEGAAIINRLVEYMRNEMVTDYTDHLVDFVY